MIASHCSALSPLLDVHVPKEKAMTPADEKRQLFHLGDLHISLWCELNDVAPPTIVESEEPRAYGTCAYYRDDVIYISINACAAPGRAGRAWSWPGYVVDRTPYGVLAHELGHHVDYEHGAAGGFLSHVWRPLDMKPLTSYAPNDNEWFAELFRLFVTNPDLLRRVRPNIADLFFEQWVARAETRPWQEVLADSERHLKAAANKIKAAR